MNNLQMIFLGSFITGLVLLLTAITLLVLFIVRRTQIKKIKKLKTKSKSKRREQKKEIKRLTKSSKKSLVSFIVFLFLSICLWGVSGYVSYYQSINLSEKDQALVVKAYYLLTDLDKQLESISKGDVDQKKASQNIQNLGGSMASYSGIVASDLNKEDGQIKINRYYNIVKEIGINASGQSQDFFENKELVTEFRNDIKKAQGYEKEVFKFYKVDNNALKKKE